MIGRLVKVGDIPVGYEVLPPKQREHRIVTMSYHSAVLRSVARSRRRKVRPQWLRRMVNAYERGDAGVSKRQVSERVIQYHVIGRGHEHLPTP